MLLKYQYIKLSERFPVQLRISLKLFRIEIGYVLLFFFFLTLYLLLFHFLSTSSPSNQTWTNPSCFSTKLRLSGLRFLRLMGA